MILRNQKGEGLIDFIAGIIVFIIICIIFSNIYKKEEKVNIAEYNKWVTETNNIVTSNQLLVSQNQPLMNGITFKMLTYIPTNIYETEDFSTAQRKIEKIKAENSLIVEQNNKQADTLNDIALRYNLMINLFK